MAAFGAYSEPRDLHELEETYARTFDINPACALEVGWHLFGEEYARGLFLVRLRGEMREHGVEESSELPDHITHVLALIAAMVGLDQVMSVYRQAVQDRYRFYSYGDAMLILP